MARRYSLQGTDTKPAYEDFYKKRLDLESMLAFSSRRVYDTLLSCFYNLCHISNVSQLTGKIASSRIKSLAFLAERVDHEVL